MLLPKPMRFPKPWTKKRGKRLLGGALSGVVGETVFYATLFLLGVFGVALMLFQRLSDASDLVKAAIPEAVPDAFPGAVTATGEASSSSLGFWIVIVLSFAMIAVGGGALIFRLLGVGASDERRSVLASKATAIASGGQAAAVLSPLENSRAASPGASPITARPGGAERREHEGDVDGEFEKPRDFRTTSIFESSVLPGVPQGRGVTDSPGMKLAYRLASEGSMARRAMATAALALLWNAAWFVLLAVVVSGFLSGNPRWVLAFLLLPFSGIGIWAFRYFLEALRQTVGVGATIVEISDHPLRPGASYEVFIAQLGRLSLRRLRVELICEEETMFRQGTDVRIDRHVVFTKILCTERDLSIDPHRPWEQELQLDLPADAMHSFRSAHNAVCWRITVSGDARPWPSFCLNFPVFVHPSVQALTRRPR
jgi:hypothetical protein